MGSGGLKQHRGGGSLLQIGQKSAFVTRKIARRARQRPDRQRKLGALLRRRYHRRMDIGLARERRGVDQAVGDMLRSEECHVGNESVCTWSSRWYAEH